LPVVWHADDPFFGRIRPDLYSLITRNDADAAGNVCPAPNWHRTHTITVADALLMMTINAAYARFRDEEVGSIEVGKYPDLIVLPDNLLTATPEALLEMDVLLTMVGGRVEFCAPGQAHLCPSFPGVDGTAAP
jgi:predicted amidohydrolase YtcJ